MKWKKPNNLPGKLIFVGLVGSHAHGTATKDSDFDFKGVYVQSPETIIVDGYKEQIEVGKDEVYYELSRFLKLCKTGNPTMLEMLFLPEDCIIMQENSWNLVLEKRDLFITKKSRWSFGGYAKQQISKAKGLNKKMNWETEEMKRKIPIDFCWVVLDKFTRLTPENTIQEDTPFTSVKQGVYPLKEWLHKKALGHNLILLTKLNHTKEGHQLYIDSTASSKGIGTDNSNNLKVSVTPKDALPIATVLYNADAYSAHCKKYKEYQTWLKNRNTQRYVDVNEHGQQIDGKNMLHCIRLLEMGLEIAFGKGLNVRRLNPDYLLSIRYGKLDLETILIRAEVLMSQMDKAFEDSSLPNEVPNSIVKELIIDIHKFKNN